MPLIDKYLPRFQFIERHELLVKGKPKDLLDAVTLADTVDDPWVRSFIKLRELPGRLLGAFGIGRALSKRAAFGLNDFTLLGRDADREIAFGLVGRFWRFDYGLVAIEGPAQFESFTLAGVPKLVLNFRVVPLARRARRFLLRPVFFAMIEDRLFGSSRTGG
jgi:hypothetical protein